MQLKFSISDIESKTAGDWQEEHNKTCILSAGNYREDVSYSKYSYVFTPTSVDTVIETVCRLCGKRKDCTDHDW